MGNTELVHTPDEGIRHIFVYGSLRPDDDSGMPWTHDARADMRGQKALVRGARMYKHDYASVKVNDWQLGIDKKPEDLSQEPVVHGWVLTADDDLWADKLAGYDRIEGYHYEDEENSLYVRKQVDIELGNEFIPASGEKLGNPGSTVRGYIYLRMSADETEPIPSGNWMDRVREENEKAGTSELEVAIIPAAAKEEANNPPQDMPKQAKIEPKKAAKKATKTPKISSGPNNVGRKVTKPKK